MASSSTLPATYKALHLTSPSEPLTLTSFPLPLSQTTPTPSPIPGTALVRVLASPILSYASAVFQNGNPRGYPYPQPTIPGPSSCIGRVACATPQAGATRLAQGDLVWVDATVVARDNNPDAVFLQGLFSGFSEASRTLMSQGEGVKGGGSMAEFVVVPLENVHVLDQAVLRVTTRRNNLGYTAAELAFLFWLLVPYGGLRDVQLRVGETIIVSPATGPFGGVAVRVALAMGAGRVVALGRNVEALRALKAMFEQSHAGRVQVVKITGDVEGDAKALRRACAGHEGSADVYFDISPPQAERSTHLASAFRALRRGARVSLMGGVMGDLAVPYGIVMHKDITIRGKWMYPQEAVPELVKMIESGALPIGRAAGIEVDCFPLEEWEAAFQAAETSTATKYAVFEPWN
ncbi:hypothetical protein BD289DRAFT_399573 [Coniella lustricola]|uniref:Alcohol dehydrogenase-like C-terminal domain-containing protein n=1 Tax=Coniella lustricola TaxID=2025994 RepID=A0A2T2ZSF8_9PEZI|nr:hypothetical protein BD289DRAFT_399573 [Coniella lustricola]